MNHYTIETHDLDVYFKDFKALDKINLSVPEGSIFGFLGPNGAGKTTTIRILLDLMHPEKGKVKIFGKELRQNRVDILKRVGALIENPSIYKHLTGRQNLEVIRKLVGVPKTRIDEVLEIVRLKSNADKKAKGYSLGMCQRLGLASALLTDPKLLILDEPTNGLDPSGIIEMRELIIELNRDYGKTIFLSSHILSEIEKLATDVAIIDRGRIEFLGKLDKLYNQNSGLNVNLDVNDLNKSISILENSQLNVSKSDDDTLNVQAESKEHIANINRILVEAGIDIYSIKSDNNLESVFLNITQKLDQ